MIPLELEKQIAALEAQRDKDIDAIYDAMGQATLAKVEYKQQQCRLLIEKLKVEYNATHKTKADA